MNDRRRNKDDTRQVLQAVGKGARSTLVLKGKLLKKIYIFTIGALFKRFAAATVLGKILTVVGLLSMCASGTFAVISSTKASFDAEEYILVTSRRANIRDSNSTKSRIVERAKQGEKLAFRLESEGWWYVMGHGWTKPAWISKAVARHQKHRTVNIRYECEGFGLGFLAAFILFYVGLCIRKA